MSPNKNSPLSVIVRVPRVKGERDRPASVCEYKKVWNSVFKSLSCLRNRNEVPSSLFWFYLSCSEGINHTENTLAETERVMGENSVLFPPSWTMAMCFCTIELNKNNACLWFLALPEGAGWLPSGAKTFLLHVITVMTSFISGRAQESG